MTETHDQTPEQNKSSKAEQKRRIRQSMADDTLAGDLLIGADELAEHLFGDPALRRKIYHLRKAMRIPVFVMSGQLCARKSTLKAWIEEQEKRCASNLYRPAAKPVVAKSPSRPDGSNAGPGRAQNPEGNVPGQPT
jgi:hypothetical protein